MDSTSYASDTTKGIDQFTKLKLQLERATREGKPVYVLGISREKHINSLEETLEKLRGLPGVYDAIPTNGVIECIATGTREEMEGLAEQVYIESYGDEVGCALYSEVDKESPSGPYGKIRKAIKIARRKGEQWHFYDESTDSFEALMAKAESKKEHRDAE